MYLRTQCMVQKVYTGCVGLVNCYDIADLFRAYGQAHTYSTVDTYQIIITVM